MNFNTFPLVTNDELQILKNNFSYQQIRDRKESIKDAYFSVQKCKSLLLGQNTKFNNKIQSSLNETNHCLDSIIENFNSTFNPPKTIINITNFNLFGFIKNLLDAISKLNNWCNDENKEHYKNIAISSAKNLIKCSKEILSALENSNIRLFKFM